MDKNHLVCLVCCKLFNDGCGGGDGGKRKEENVKSLQQFCDVILEVDKNEFKSSFVENQNDGLSICGNCLDIIGGVTEARLSAKGVEESVEKLQVLLLRELRRLQGRLEVFWSEFEKMEGIIVNGDLKLIENSLEGSYSIGNDEGKRRKGWKISPKHLERKMKIFEFRGKISQVFSNFHQFHVNLIQKTTCNPVNQTSSARTSKRKSADKPVNKMKIQDLSSPPPVQPAINEIGHDDDGDDNCVEMDDEPMHLDNLDDDQDQYNIIEDIIRPTDKRASLRRRSCVPKKYQLESDDDEDDLKKVGEDDYTPEEEVNKSSKQVKKRKGKKSKHPKSSGSSSDPKAEKKVNSDDDSDDEEYKPDDQPDDDTGPIGRTKIYRIKIANLIREYQPHLVEMSPFKRNLVKSVLKCQVHHEILQKRKGAEKMTIFQQHMVHLSYNLETKLINLKDVPIKIVCQVDGEEDDGGGNGLLCTHCNFKVDECPKMENLMYEHVLSKHLNAYQCPHCKNKDKQFENYPQYSLHVYKCLRRKQDVDRVECDICGKSICDGRALRNHKWSHMNEEEKAEAFKSGFVKKVPMIKIEKEKRFQCAECGKSFSAPGGLKSHEETHRERESREQFICAKCGKSFLKVGYEYHLKYSEICGEEDPNRKRESCVKCGKILKTKQMLRRHLKFVHGEGDLKLVGCEVCGKGFKTRAYLKEHEKMHTGEKNWGCGKCGMRFTKKWNMVRHELTCEKGF